MKRTVAKILCVFIVVFWAANSLSGQDRAVRIGFQTSPVISWISNNDNLILKNGGELGLKLGATADIYFKNNLSFTTGLNLAFHEGGEFLYTIGGNYLPDSELSDPLLQTGDKPLPDGTRIRYKLQYLEIPLGLKFRTQENGNFRYFAEVPVFNFAFLTRGRGDIQTQDMKYEQENIYKDLGVVNLFWGFGGGLEYAISDHSSLIGGLYYQSGLFDFTRDNGYRAVPNPEINPPYIRQTDDSRAALHSLVIRLGIIF